MNWTGIKTLAAQYMHRTDMDARFDLLLELVMKDLLSDLDVIENEALATFTMTAHPNLPGIFQSALPADFDKPKVFTPGGTNQDAYSPTTLIAMMNNVATTQYAIVGRNVLVRNAAPFIGIYGQSVVISTVGSTENLFMLYYPTACLYGLLVHACNSIQDFDAVQVYKPLYDGACHKANADKAWTAMGAGAAPQSSYFNP